MALSFSRPDPSSPDAVAAASFSTGRRGFEQSEVRDFLRMVAAELARLQERERYLDRELRTAQRNTPNPAVPLDEEIVTRLLGEEAARILSTSREAASQIKIRAEEAAARLLREATDEAQRTREEAQLEAARRRQDATADAESEVEMAKQQGREMVNETRAYRERVLSELARRRELAREQIEQLVHGRDRLVQAFERARLAAVDVMSELVPLGEPAEYVNLSPTTGPVPVMVPNRPLPVARTASRVATPPAVRDVDAEDAAPVEDIAEPAPVVALFAGEIIVDAPAADEQTVDAIELEPASEVSVVTNLAAVADEPPPDDVATDVDPDVDVDVDVEAAAAIADDELVDQVETSAEHAPAHDVPSTTEAGPDDGATDETVPVELPLDDGATDDGATDDVPSDDVTSDDVTSDDVTSDDVTSDDVTSDDVTSDEVTIDDVTSDEMTIDGVTSDDMTIDEAAAPEPASAPDDTPAAVEAVVEPTADAEGVDDLFARLRAARAASVAERAAMGTPVGREPVPPDATVALLRPEPLSVFDPSPTAPEPSGEVDDTPFGRRDTALAPVILAGARKLKRILADEQNDVLHALRRTAVVTAIEPMLPGESEHAQRYAAAIVAELAEAAAAGAASVSTEARSEPTGRLVTTATTAAAATKAAEAIATSTAIEALTANILAPLRERLARAITAADGDNTELASLARAIYREWKIQQIDDHLDDVIRIAFGRGALAALEPGTHVHWVHDPRFPVCSDCDDNALSGVLGAGEPFATGQPCAPAHEGCRCMLATVAG